MLLFKQKTPSEGSRSKVVRRFETARYVLLAALIVTVINIALLLFGNGTYFLFSISMPYWSVDPGDILMCVFSGFVLLFYFLAWLRSKKKPGWLKAAMIAFAIDCGYLAFFSSYLVRIFQDVIEVDIGSADFIADYIIHAAVLVILIIGTVNAKKYKAAPDAKAEATETGQTGKA